MTGRERLARPAGHSALVLATDGVWDVMPNDDAAECVRAALAASCGESAPEGADEACLAAVACDALVDESAPRLQDAISAGVVLLPPPSPTRARARPPADAVCRGRPAEARFE